MNEIIVAVITGLASVIAVIITNTRSNREVIALADKCDRFKGA